MNKAWKALSDGTRREILRMLRGRDMIAGEIAAHFTISKPSISHHLTILKDANLVKAERNGQEMVYSINETVLQEFLATLLEYFEKGEDDDATKD